MLSLAGMAVIGYFLLRQFVTGSVAPWVFVLGLLALAAWLTGTFVRGRPGPATVPPSALELAAAAVMVLCGAVGSAPSDGVLVVLVAVGVLRFAAAPAVSVWLAGVVAVVAVVLIALGSLTVATAPLSLLALVGAVALGFLGGVNRRQAELAAERRRELAERTMVAREEHAKTALLEGRQTVARDIHDVLAHSLGGLVIQLDAAEALLESGRTKDAAVRLHDARGLAASGLAEARRAVEALREPPSEAPVPVNDLRASLLELVDAHRGLGGAIELVEHGDVCAEPAVDESGGAGKAGAEVPAAAAVALRRALQESLSNARKHAPGHAVHVVLDWGAFDVVLQVRNRMSRVRNADSAALAASGGGHGLAGMTERFAAVEGGSVSAAPCGGEFVVRAEVPWGRP